MAHGRVFRLCMCVLVFFCQAHPSCCQSEKRYVKGKKHGKTHQNGVWLPGSASESQITASSSTSARPGSGCPCFGAVLYAQRAPMRVVELKAAFQSVSRWARGTVTLRRDTTSLPSNAQSSRRWGIWCGVERSNTFCLTEQQCANTGWRLYLVLGKGKANVSQLPPPPRHTHSRSTGRKLDLADLGTGKLLPAAG